MKPASISRRQIALGVGIVYARASALAGLPPGEYHLAIGLYDAETQQRPPTQDPNDDRLPGDYYLLPDTFAISTWDGSQ